MDCFGTVDTPQGAGSNRLRDRMEIYRRKSDSLLLSSLCKPQKTLVWALIPVVGKLSETHEREARVQGAPRAPVWAAMAAEQESQEGKRERSRFFGKT